MEKDEGLSLPAQEKLQAQKAAEAMNGLSARFGLRLTAEALLRLQGGQKAALAETGRIEFGGDILQKIEKETSFLIR